MPVCGAATGTGLVRVANEDSLVVGRRVFAVADGVGGHAAGDVASALVVSRLRRLGGRCDLEPADVLQALMSANADILAAVRGAAGLDGMATTVAGLGLVRVGGAEHWLVFNIGDSRVYRLMSGALVRMTADHSEVAELVSAGRITEEQARSHPRRNVLTRSLGTDPAPIADTWVFPPDAGERFLICSDGLTGELTEARIAAVLSGEPDVQRAADELVDAANAAGGRDNVTVVVVDVPLSWADRPADANDRTAPRPTLPEVSR